MGESANRLPKLREEKIPATFIDRRYNEEIYFLNVTSECPVISAGLEMPMR